MIVKGGVPRLRTGVPNLDLILGEGLPTGSVSVVAGPPGSGKTILAQQFSFHNASESSPVLYFSTLTEPAAKTLLYMSQFSYFEPKKMDKTFHMVDLGAILRTDGLPAAVKLLMDQVKQVKPGIVVIDSFKTFDDLSKSNTELRQFAYEVGVNLMAWEVTGLLLGEWAQPYYETNPLFSIADGLVTLSHAEVAGEWQRFIQVHKMRGISHNRDAHPFAINDNGLEIYTARLTIRRSAEADRMQRDLPRLPTGVSGLDELLGEGVPHGSCVLVSGVPGSGKTILLLEFLYRGAQVDQKGVLFSFEETPDRIQATARGLGWDLDREIERGMVEIVFIPQPDIMLEANLLMMHERLHASEVKRVAIDSVSVFLHKVQDARAAQEKIFQLATVVQREGAVGFFATDVPFGSGLISRLGVEETIIDGVILLDAAEHGLDRERYLEVYKLRNTAHVTGRHPMVIGAGGISVFPRRVNDAKPRKRKRHRRRDA
jgi:circadian clock protein KaiC